LDAEEEVVVLTGNKPRGEKNNNDCGGHPHPLLQELLSYQGRRRSARGQMRCFHSG